MCYYDYDHEAEPNYPEVEEIIDEASGKFNEFLHKAFANEYKNIQGAKEHNAATENLLREREKSLSETERKLQEREAELAKSEEEQYKKLKAKWFTELGLAFDIGDAVYYYKDVTERVVCPTCKGNKKVKAKVESVDSALLDCELDCPICKGFGKIVGEKEYEVVEAEVSEINAHIRKMRTDSINIVSHNYCGHLTTYVWVKDKKGGESHQIEGRNLYKTKEECKQAIRALKEGK